VVNRGANSSNRVAGGQAEVEGPKPRLRANGKQKGAGIFHYEFGLVGKMRENRLLTDSRFERSIL